jgi:hypothetical protein
MRRSCWGALGSVLVVGTGCVVEIRVGNGVLETEARQVDAFSGVVAAFSIPVDVVEGGEPSVEVLCDSNLLEFVVTRVEGRDLVIEGARRGLHWVQIEPATDCRVRVVSSGLREARSTGSGLLSVLGESAPLALVSSTGSGGLVVEASLDSVALEGLVTGSGDLVLASVSAARVDLASSGSGGIEVDSGLAAALSVQVSGSGPVYARGLVADEVEARLSGSGGGEVTAADSLVATLSGSGGLVVWGSPADRDVIETGSGRVTFAE